MAKILIIGAGVIGSIYGAKLIKAGNEVSFYTKGKRLEFLQREGLIIKWMNDHEERFPNIRCFSTIPEGEVYDYVLITVRNENLESVYPLLNKELSPSIVFMVNNPNGSIEYLKHVEKKRLIIGFPGAGGEIRDGEVHGHIVSRFIQPTTIGNVSKENQTELIELKQIVNKAGLPVSINRNMDSWLLNHLAMVCPLGNAIYADGGDNYSASKNRMVMKETVLAMKEAFRFLKTNGFGIIPSSNYFFLYCPTSILTYILSMVYNTKWANTVIANHSLNARNEMYLLSEGFSNVVKEKRGKIPVFEKLASFNKGYYSTAG